MNKIEAMGVLNITPDSFSDGRLYLEKNSFLKHWNDLLPWVSMIDIGAVSTNPRAKETSPEEEWRRWEEYFLPFLPLIHFPQKISIDTYRPSIFRKVAFEIWKMNPQQEIILNDVSGQIDDELFQLWHDFSARPFTSIFCHNHVPHREATPQHMKVIKDGPIMEEMVKAVSGFQKVRAQWPLEFRNRLIFDPCFGFAKSRDQNIELLHNFHELLNLFPDLPFVWGISRKSFLREIGELAGVEIWDRLRDQEEGHLKDLLSKMKQSHYHLIVRTHRPYQTLTNFRS